MAELRELMTERPSRIPSERLMVTSHDGTRLVVRHWCRTDVESFHQAMLDSFEHLQPWMPWAAAEPQDIEAHEAIVNRWSSEWNYDDFGYGMFLDGRVVGACGLHNRIGADGWEIGYWVRPDCEGRGIVSAVVRALTDEAFVDPTIHRVEIRCDAANVRSANVPKRLGFSLVAEEVRFPVTSAETEVGHVYRVEREVWLG
jgi:RimJ/RimL family protein N-acetyltransferase